MDRQDAHRAQQAARLRTALELQRAGVAMMKKSLERRFPQESEEEIGRRLAAWLQARPGAEFGDGEGRPVGWPRPGR